MYSGLGFDTFGQNFAPFCKDLGFTSFLVRLTTIYYVVSGYQTALSYAVNRNEYVLLGIF